MERRRKRIIVCASATSAVLLSGALTLKAQNTDVRPEIVRPQDNGSVHNQRIILKNFFFQFFENKKTIGCLGDVIEFELSKNENNKLANATVTLIADPDRPHQWKIGRPSAKPLSNSTVYWDLDGDTVFDAMVKHSPDEKERGSYILYKNAWLQVGDSHLGFSADLPKTSFDHKATYRFIGNKWEIEK